MIGWRYQGDPMPYLGLVEDDTGRHFADQVVRRDKLRCIDCGFVSRASKSQPGGFMQAIPKDADYGNASPDNWACICPTCHASRNARVALESGQYRLIVAPFMSQSQLSNMTRPLMALVNDVDHLYHADAHKIFKRLEALEAAIASLIPSIPNSEDSISDNIELFLSVVDNMMTPRQYANRNWFAQSLRIIPTRKCPPLYFDYWDQGVYAQYPFSSWERLLSWKKEDQH